jgi:hypothetical protein
MRRAIAAERTVERAGSPAARTTAAIPAPPTTGVRARRLANQMLERLSFPMSPPAPPAIVNDGNGDVPET